MVDPAVLVLGPPSDALAVLRALRSYAVHAWSDELSRLIEDPATLACADAVVVIDTSLTVESATHSQIRQFEGPKLLAVAVPQSISETMALVDDGFDVVLHWPALAEVVAARAARMLRAPRLAGTAVQRRQLAA